MQPALRQRHKEEVLPSPAAALLLDVEAPPAALQRTSLSRSSTQKLSRGQVQKAIHAAFKGNLAPLSGLFDNHEVQRGLLMLVVVDLVLVSVHVQLAGLFGGEEILWVICEVVSMSVLFSNVCELVARYAHITHWSAISYRDMLKLFITLITLVLELSEFHNAKLGARLVVRVFRSFGLIHSLALAVEYERAELRNFREMETELAKSAAVVSQLRRELYNERSVRAHLEAELSLLNSRRRAGEAI